VKSIRFTAGQANILSYECILCGRCFVGCPQNAKVVRNDVPLAEMLLARDMPVYASVAPSFAGNYPGMTITSIENALAHLGFAGAEETAVGAKLVKDEYDCMVASGQHDVIISSCCHSLNLLIQKHYPEALPYLAGVLSPMLAHAQDLKRRHPDCKVVFIGPCIAKKDEADRYGTVDCVLTFEELTAWLARERIELQYAPDCGNVAGRTRIFPTNGGVLRSMDANDLRYVYMAVDGVENCKRAIEDVLAGKLHRCFIEMSSCAGSCLGGPAMDSIRPAIGYCGVARYVRPKDFTAAPLPNIHKDMEPLQKPRKKYSDYEIAEVLRSIGKTKKEHELNCGCCGYSTCREKAVAVLEGKADVNMCLPYIKDRALSYSSNIINNTPNGILILNEMYEVQQINPPACALLKTTRERAVGQQVVSIMDPTPFFDAMMYGKEVRDRRAYLPEAKAWVDQTVLFDRENHTALCVLHDVTAVAMQEAEKESIRRRTIEVADRVIEKQMRSVQEIAALLGESTAETKVALTKLKESMKDE